MSLDSGGFIGSGPSLAASPSKKPNTRSTHPIIAQPVTSTGQLSQGSPHSEPSQSLDESEILEHPPRAKASSISLDSQTQEVRSTEERADPPPAGMTPVDSSHILQKLFARFDTVENKLKKLDSMEMQFSKSQLSKSDVIESKTDGLVTDMQTVQGSINSLRNEVESVKSKAKSVEVELRKEVSSLQAQIKTQDAKMARLAGEVEDRVLEATHSHFNDFTRHIELAFVKEQAANRKQNLILSGVPENERVPDIAKVCNICSSSLKLSNLSIDSATRMGAQAHSSDRPRPILVHFANIADRRKVWQAIKKLQKKAGNKIGVQEDMPRALREDLRVLIKVAKQAASLGKEEYNSIRVRDFRLLLHDKSYGTSELELLPYDLRPSTICTNQTDNVVIFFGHFSPLSNHHPSKFTVNNVDFSCVEQYLAVARARLSGDDAILQRALSCPNPADCKGILNSLRDDHAQEWEECRSGVLMRALRNKFGQNKDLGSYLRATNPRHIGEASSDPVWGIGLSLEDENAASHASWHVEGNLLGRSLNIVRGELINELGSP